MSGVEERQGAWRGEERYAHQWLMGSLVLLRLVFQLAKVLLSLDFLRYTKAQ